MMAGRLSGRVFTPSFSTRPAKLAVSKQHRNTKRQQVSRDVARRAGTDDVGSSYANALVDLAEEQNVLNDIHDDVETLTALFKEDEDLKEFLTNPIIEAEEKKEVISKVGEKAKFSDFFVDFLNILIDEDRLISAEDIFSAFEDRYCELTDTQVATIYSAVKLEQEQQFLVAKKLQELTGSKNIKLKTVIDESLIAGFSVDFGSAQIDLSIKGQLEDVAQDLVAGAQGLDLGGMGKSSNGNGSEGVPQDELLGNTDVQKEVEKELSSAEGKKAAALA